MRTFQIILFCLLTTTAYSQYRTISGTLTDENGEALIGVTIVEKGTSNGVVTDFDGNYSIRVPVGSTLVYSYIGFATREVVVGLSKNSGFVSAIKPFPVELLNDTLDDVDGVGTFDSESRHIKVDNLQSVNKLKSICERKDHFVFKYYDDAGIIKGAGLQVSISVGSSIPNKLPKFQETYAQGTPLNGELVWRGPGENEIFSWGPRLVNLEYDGSNYAYDPGGMLVPIGSGNGTPAKTFNNSEIFGTGYLSKYDILYTHSISRKGHIIAGASHESNEEIIPFSGKKNTTFTLDLEDVSLGEKSRLSFRSFYNQSSGSLLAHGANIARIIGEVYSTPVTFDNANGYSSQNAFLNSDSYLLQDGSVRSFSPAFANNPYQLISGSPDKDYLRHSFSGLEYSWSENKSQKEGLDIRTLASYDKQNLLSEYGYLPGTIGFSGGLLSSRLNEKEQFDYELNTTYRIRHYSSSYFKIDLDLNYHLSYTAQVLQKNSGTGFEAGREFIIEQATSKYYIGMDPDRLSHELFYAARMDFNNILKLDIRNRTYFSSTADPQTYSNFFPYLEANGVLNIYPFEFRPYIKYSRSIQEASLIYNDWAYQSLACSSGDYRSFYEQDELVSSGLLPEIESVFQIGLNTEISYQAYLRFNYSSEMLDNYIVPLFRNGQFQLMNAAKVSNRSYRTSFEINRNYGWKRFSWHLGVRWSVNNTRVEELYLNQDVVPLAGFSNASTVLIEGQEIGVIYGTAFSRNEKGELIIGPEGFPVVSEVKKILGNPNPDWILGVEPTIEWRKLKLEAQFEVLYGGQIWNGTSAYLDYLGKSEKTGAMREIRDYIFEGVDAEGNPNAIPVDLFDHEQDVLSNRWSRYGPEGVTEEYIEDASCVRIRNLVLGYTLPRFEGSKFGEISVALLLSNIYLYNPYSGADPGGLLFGNSMGEGLDLFNLPSTRSFTLKLSCKL